MAARNGHVAVPQEDTATAQRPAAKAAKAHADEHAEYEFGGPPGTLFMMVFFPCLLYYLWICLTVFDGRLQIPNDFSDVVPFVRRFYHLAGKHAPPTVHAAKIYLGLMAYQLGLALLLTGYQQEGLPIDSLNGKRLMYNCNGVQSLYITLASAALAHYTNFFRLSELIDHFGSIMTVSILASFAIAGICYFGTVTFGTPLRMSGNFFYDYFMGAILNPRIGSVDIKMVAEVRVPWLLLFLLSVGGCIKQFDTYGFVSANQAFMVLASGLQLNACAKGEDCIPQTWDMTYEKFGWLLAFWNFAGVPFTYSYSILWMSTHNPADYRFSTLTYVALYGAHMLAHYVFDTSMAQKSHFKMQMAGQTHQRWTFPQWPGNTVHNPTYIQCENGGKLLTSGWWAYLRKPNYAADIVQVATWALCCGYPTPIVYWYPVFFLAMIVHRVGRDFTRCQRKYGKDWDRVSFSGLESKSCLKIASTAKKFRIFSSRTSFSDEIKVICLRSSPFGYSPTSDSSAKRVHTDENSPLFLAMIRLSTGGNEPEPAADLQQRARDWYNGLTRRQLAFIGAGSILAVLLLVASGRHAAVSSGSLGGGAAAGKYHDGTGREAASYLNADLEFTDETQTKFECPTSYIDVIDSVVRPKVSNDHIPILNIEQITWISTIVHTSARLRHGEAHNFLVYGLGFDSLVWRSSNCVPGNTHSRTLFVENWLNWIQDVKATLPFVDVLHLTYNTTVANSAADLADPSRIDPVPSEIAERCWDVTLVDAPQGWNSEMPGRVAPSFWSMEMAERCLKSGARDTVFIFLHDVEREAEGAIANAIFERKGIRMGSYAQPLGELRGWIFTRESISR